MEVSRVTHEVMVEFAEMLHAWSVERDLTVHDSYVLCELWGQTVRAVAIANAVEASAAPPDLSVVH